MERYDSVRLRFASQSKLAEAPVCTYVSVFCRLELNSGHHCVVQAQKLKLAAYVSTGVVAGLCALAMCLLLAYFARRRQALRCDIPFCTEANSLRIDCAAAASCLCLASIRELRTDCPADCHAGTSCHGQPEIPSLVAAPTDPWCFPSASSACCLSPVHLAAHTGQQRRPAPTRQGPVSLLTSHTLPLQYGSC